MKPLEEVWVAEAGNVYHIASPTTHAELAFPSKERAQLAAQAPAMARSLLAELLRLQEEGLRPLDAPAHPFVAILRDAGVLP